MEAESDTDASSFASTPSSEETIHSDPEVDSGDVCPVCNVVATNLAPIKDIEELQSIKEFIEKNSSRAMTVNKACLTCLYKFYLVIDQNRLQGYKSEQKRRLSVVAALINSSGGSIPGQSPVPDIDSDDPADATVAHLQPAIIEVAENVDQRAVHQDKDLSCEESVEQSFSEDFNESGEHEMSNRTENDLATSEQGSNLIRSGARSLLRPNRNRSNSTRSSTQSRLDVMYERSESALATESGGNLDQYKDPPLQCRYCPKVFVLIKPYNKHMRAHESKLSIRSASSSRARSGRSTPTNRIYECADCSATFDSSTKLKHHRRIHLKRYYCTFCHEENFSLFDHEFHEAQCRGGHMAKDETTATRRITRSIKSRQTTQTTKTDGANNNSNVSSRPAKSSRTFSTLPSRRTLTRATEDNDDDEDDDDDDGATSVACTDITGVTSYIANWVAGTYRSEYEHPLTNSLQDKDQEPVVVTESEFNLVRLERLMREAERNIYLCTFEDCDYVTNILRDMCLHQMVIHKTKSFFDCRQCCGVFTSRLFADYHMSLQRFCEYPCYKCDMVFKFEHKLLLHLEQHKRCESIDCLECGKSFIGTVALQQHSSQNGHDPTKRKRLICIDRELSIINDTECEPPPPKRVYQSTIKILQIPPKPTKTPMHIIWPNGKSIFLGDIDFDYRPGWNCIPTR